MMNNKFGVSAMIRCAVYLEDTLGIELVSIGRAGLDRKDTCCLECAGRNLFYWVRIDGGFVFLSAVALDDPMSKPEPLLSIGDTADGWKQISRLTAALERSGIKSLDRPIEVGLGGSNGWVIA
jgi:hypothetical protein